MKFPLTVSNRQKGNQLLKILNGVKMEWTDDTVADYSIGEKVAVLFLALTYHRQHPEYLGERIKQLKGLFPVRILLFLVNSEKADLVIQKLTIFCNHNNINIVLAFDYEEAGRWILSLYNSQENTVDHLKAMNETNLDMAIEAISALGPSRKEAESLLGSFSTIADCLLASKEEIENSGIFLNPTKVDAFIEAANSPF